MIQEKFLTPRAALAVLAAFAGSASPALATDAPQPFAAPRDDASYDRALQCLTQAIYYEARSESDDGQRAVAQVVLNRVRHPSYPNSVCGVVYQGSTRRTGCQFTFTCDGSITGYVDRNSWARAQRIATAALRGYVYRPVGLSLNYHTTAIRPYWAPSLVRHTVIGAHIFYRQPGSGTIDAFYQAPAAFEPRPGASGVTMVARAARGPSPTIARLTREFQPARVELARVERPTIERALFERPVSSRTTRRGAAATPQRQPQAQAQARPAAARRGPRTTMENGVRVARGS